jgi:hypothetical protein
MTHQHGPDDPGLDREMPAPDAGMSISATIVAALAAIGTTIAMSAVGDIRPLGDPAQGGAAQFIGDLFGPWLPGAIVVAGVFIGLGHIVRRPWLVALVAGALIGVSVAYGIELLQTIADNILQPPGWDIGGFIILGEAAARGDPYDIDLIKALAAAYPYPGTNYVGELFPYYPPTSLVLFMPLAGFDSLSEATRFWYLILLSGFVGAIVLTWQIFMRRLGVLGLPLAAATILVFAPTAATLDLGQTNALLLCAGLLVVAAASRWSAGVWIVIGGMVKPFFLFLALPYLVRREWRPLAAALATGIGVLALTAVVIGPRVLIDYARGGHDFSNYPFTQSVNASLTGLLARFPWAGGGPGGFKLQPMENPYFLTVALAVIIVTIWLVHHRDVVPGDMAVSLMVPVALMIYPASLGHYSLMLIVPLMVIWSRREQFGLGDGAFGALLLTSFVIAGFDGGKFDAFANGLIWAVLVVMAYGLIRRPAPEMTRAGGRTGSLAGATR